MKIVIADDHAVVRTGFSMILNFQEDMEVVATAADGVEAYQKVMEYKAGLGSKIEKANRELAEIKYAFKTN